jgi:hypothetical protein
MIKSDFIICDEERKREVYRALDALVWAFSSVKEPDAGELRWAVEILNRIEPNEGYIVRALADLAKDDEGPDEYFMSTEYAIVVLAAMLAKAKGWPRNPIEPTDRAAS